MIGVGECSSRASVGSIPDVGQRSYQRDLWLAEVQLLRTGADRCGGRPRTSCALRQQGQSGLIGHLPCLEDTSPGHMGHLRTLSYPELSIAPGPSRGICARTPVP